jgi:hypothetical protein
MLQNVAQGINGKKKGYQPGTNLAKDENGYLLADSYSSLCSQADKLFLSAIERTWG